jgi:hypothetical protein
MIDYRNDARNALERAKAELASEDEERLKYAALELRMAMESITYDRALAYKEEFPDKEYDTWQPKKVMAVLLEIDANADKDSSISFGKEPALGVPAPVMHSLGAETVLNMATIKEHYDALGSYLHVQTVKQVKKGLSVNYAKVRKRCGLIAEYLGKVLASTLWNSTFGHFATFDCEECGVRVRRRLPLDGSPTVAQCECGARYDVFDKEGGKFMARLQGEEVACPTPTCEAVTFIPQHFIRAGVGWKCSRCGTHIKIKLGLHIEESESAAAP